MVNTLSASATVAGIKLLRACVCAHSPVLGNAALGLPALLPGAWAANS